MVNYLSRINITYFHGKIGWMEEERFPLFLKTPNDKSFYRILDRNSLTEIQIIGKKYILFEIEATILPERNLIHDLIENEKQKLVKIDEREFLDRLSFCKENLEEIKN